MVSDSQDGILNWISVAAATFPSQSYFAWFLDQMSVSYFSWSLWQQEAFNFLGSLK